MEISIITPDTFYIHIDRKELEMIYNALDTKRGMGYYFMARKIEETIREVKQS